MRNEKTSGFTLSTLRGFSLVEMLVVLSILSLLAALLFPVLLTVRGKARSSVCASNLRQIGLAVDIYSQDYDSFFPYAVDPIDRVSPQLWSSVPTFAADIPSIGLIQDVLHPYVQNPEVFHCPADIGFSAADFPQVSLPSFPTAYQSNGTSYCYRTELAATHAQQGGLRSPTETVMLCDAVGYWHGTLVPIASRYNLLYADGHVKNVNVDETNDAWATSLR